jgi:hypothetical protein
LYLSTFRLRRCTTLLTPSSAGQLGRKLREWGVYKYDSKNRFSDAALRLYHDGLDEDFGEPFPQAVLEDLSNPKDPPVQATFASDLSTAHTESLQDTDTEHYMSYSEVSGSLPNPDGMRGTFTKLPEPPEPTEYDDADLTYAAFHNSLPAVISVSNNSTMSMNTSQHVKVHEEDTASSVSVMAVATKEPGNTLPDIDMDRFSLLSLTPSVSSGFASLRSLAQRILLRQREGDSLRRDSLDDLPSSVMDWNRSNSSLRLFRELSSSSSIASSQMTTGSRMNHTMLSNGSQYRYAPTEKLQFGISQQSLDLPLSQVSLVDCAESVCQCPPILTGEISPPVHICVACNLSFRNKGSLSKHWEQHCERGMEWACLLCVPIKIFNCKEKLCRHHISNHGKVCIRGCKNPRRLLCEEGVAWSEYLRPKQAWGCPCCLQCFDTFAAWTKHSAIHPLQNGKVIGWSLNTMVQSLMLQPYLTDAIAYLPWHMFDLAGAKVDVCQNLREILERHKIPDTVRYHYDYIYLRLPEALVQYVFRLVTYGVPCGVPNDVSYLDTSFAISENAAKAVAERSNTRCQGAGLERIIEM